MDLQSNYHQETRTLLIKLSGRFGYESHASFQTAYTEKAISEIDNIVLDLSDVDYLDASALGMLLLLKDHAGDHADISIINCQEDVYKVFEVASLNLLFQIIRKRLN